MLSLRLLLIVCALLCLGGKAVDPFTHGEACSVAYQSGSDDATSNDDYCPSVTAPDQFGVNDPAGPFAPMVCTSTERPYFVHEDARSCLGVAGTASRFSITPGSDIEFAQSVGLWIYPTTDATAILFDHVFFSPGIRFGYANCGTDEMRLSLLVAGIGTFYGSCGGVVPDEWQFVGFTWRGNSGTDMRFYATNTSASNTLLDAGPTTILQDYDPQTLLITMMAGVFNTAPFGGYSIDYLILDDNYNDVGMCYMCRAGAGGGFRGEDLLRRQRDAYDLCNQCAFGSGLTHIGASRRQN